MTQTHGGSELQREVSSVSSLAWEYSGLLKADGRRQMDLDRQLLAEVRSAERTSPILRFYQWTPPAVSFGYNQKAADSIRLAEAERSGYEIVQRPTGGRALLHKGDLCYAVIARSNWHHEFRSLSSTYRAISRAHRLTLKKLGVTTSESPEDSAKPPSALTPCFAMINPFEVTVRGRKICGSAQYRAEGAFLQHGSLRIYDNWTDSDLAELWPEGMSLSRRGLSSLQEELESAPRLEEVAESWREAFSEVFQVELKSS